MAYQPSQNSRFPVNLPQTSPIRGPTAPPTGPGMNQGKPNPDMYNPGMYTAPNGQMGQVPRGNGPALQNLTRPGGQVNNINGYSRQPAPPSMTNSPGYYATPQPSTQSSPGFRSGPGGLPTSTPNGPIPLRPPVAGMSRPQGPPPGPTPLGLSSGPPPSGPPPPGLSSRPVPSGPPPSGPPSLGPLSGPTPHGQQYRPPPMPGGRYPVNEQQTRSLGQGQPVQSTPSSLDSGDRPNELPVPFHGHGQYSHQIGQTMRLSAPITPSNSEPTSRKSSRAPSPVTSPTYDALEGQFTPGSQGSTHGTPPPTGPISGENTAQSDSAQKTGIAGRRVYPQSPSQFSGQQHYGNQLVQQQSLPGQLSGPPGQLSGPPGQLSGPPGQLSGLPGQLSGPPGQFSGPLGQFSGPPGQLSGSPGRFSGPPGQLSGPPGQLSGPPGQLSGPPGQLSGPPGQLSGPPGQLSGPPGQLSGPPGRFSGPQGQLSQSLGPPGVSGQTGTQQFQGQPGQQQFQGTSGPQRFQGPPGAQQFQGPPGPQQFQGQPGSQQLSGPPVSHQHPGQQQFSGPPIGPQQYTRPQQFAGPPAGPPSGPGNIQPGLPPTGYPNVPQTGSGGSFQQRPQQPGFPLPQVGQQSQPNTYPGAPTSGFGQMSLLDNARAVNLLQERHLIPPTGVEETKPNLQHDFKKVNCSPDVFRCTLTSIPQTSSLLNKARLPLGILIHPFKDLSQLPVIQSSVIVRCRSCRTYINPFVSFVDTRRWKCNLCYRVNDIPDEFSFDPISKTYGDPQRRPEVRSSTIEFIAPSEYMLRPPQPAVYLFVLDVSFNAIETGYLSVFCETLLEELDKLPGDARTHIGFVAFDRAVHFFNLAEGLSQPQLLTVSDIEDIFLPSPDNLLVNIHESKELVIDLLNQLPTLFEDNQETGNALGAALQAAYKMMSATGGRVTVVQTCLPTAGPGALTAREDPALRKSKDVQNAGPATDFYKKLALDCSAQQIAVDLFLLNGLYTDVATLACISKYSSGCIYSYPSFHAMRNPPMRERLETDLRRYLTRKIGFEAVMRIRCTKGLSIHTFHGNFFVRSTDLLSLPNINPDAGFGMQMSIEDSLTDSSTVCFQAALLYTSSKGERRIRVHTMCLPVTNQLTEVFSGADQKTIVGLLAKMAADRTVTASLNEAREALINAALDSVSAYSGTLTSSQRVNGVPAAFSLRVVPLYVLALLKSMPFRVGSVTPLDERVIALEKCKTLPLSRLIQMIHPDLYPVHALSDENGLKLNEDQPLIPQPPLLHLSSANLDRHGAFLMDTGDNLYMLVGSAVSDQFCMEVFEQPNFMSLEDGLHELPELENLTSERLRLFINYLIDQRPQGVIFTVLREDSKERGLFFQHMVEDRSESTMSYYEFVQYLQKQVKA